MGDAAADTPIFSLSGPVWRAPAGESVRLACAGQGVVFLLVGNRLLRYSLATGESVTLELCRAAGTPSGLFADPHSSICLIVAHASGDNVFVHRARSRLLGKAKNLVITAVAWLPPVAARPDTRDVLLGTSSGTIYDASIEPSRTTRYRQVYALTPSAPIVGLQADHVNLAGSAHAAEGRRLFVLVATPTRYYEFVGAASADALFAEYRDLAQLGYVEVEGPPTGIPWPPPLQGGTLVLERSHSTGAPAAFGWLTAKGAYTGSLLFGAQRAGDSCVYNFELRPYPDASRLSTAAVVTTDKCSVHDERATRLHRANPTSFFGLPSDMALMPHHLLLLYRGGVAAISRLSGELVEVAVPHMESAPLLGMICGRAIPTDRAYHADRPGLSAKLAPRAASQKAFEDQADTPIEDVWVWGVDSLWKVEARCESRHEWRLHLEAGDFEQALTFTEGVPERRDQVLRAMAEHNLSEREFLQAARNFARSAEPVEAVALRFLAHGQKSALRAYLAYKLDEVEPHYAMQRTMLATWQCELFLQELSSLPEATPNTPERVATIGSTSFTEDISTCSPSLTVTHPVDGTSASQSLARDFSDFLRSQYPVLSSPLTISMLEAAGRHEELALFYSLSGDWERLLALHIQMGRADKAVAQLRALVKDAMQQRPTSGLGGGDSRSVLGLEGDLRGEVQRLVDRFGTEMLKLSPAAAVEAWTEATFLDPTSLLPAFFRYDERWARLRSELPERPVPGESESEPGQVTTTTKSPMAKTRRSFATRCAPLASLKHHVLDYLRHVVANGCASPQVHNALLLLHVRRSSDGDLLLFLGDGGGDHREPNGEGCLFSLGDSLGESVARGVCTKLFAPNATHNRRYDPHLALRLCWRHGRVLACVRLYQLLRLPAQAVNAALIAGDISLAKRSANMPTDARERRQLWVQILRHVLCGEEDVNKRASLNFDDALHRNNRSNDKAASAIFCGDVEGRGDIGAALQILQESSCLTLQDVLHFLPQISRIDSLKAPICASLSAHGRERHHISAEQADNASTALKLSHQAESLRHRSCVTNPATLCACVDMPPMMTHTCGGCAIEGHRSVGYPCGHVFRLRCVEVLRPTVEREKLRKRGQGEADAALCAECPLCGSAMVANVRQPLLDPAEDALLLESWAV